MTEDNQSGKPTKETIEKYAQQELKQQETQTANNTNPNTQGSTNEVQPVATDDGITQ